MLLTEQLHSALGVNFKDNCVVILKVKIKVSANFDLKRSNP
jgi:hypothetical protein